MSKHLEMLWSILWVKRIKEVATEIIYRIYCKICNLYILALSPIPHLEKEIDCNVWPLLSQTEYMFDIYSQE